MDVLLDLAQFTLKSLGNVQFFGISGPVSQFDRTFAELRVSCSGGTVTTSSDLERRLDRVLLAGPPGSGKTTLLKHLARSLAGRFLNGEAGVCCPLLVHGKELLGSKHLNTLEIASAVAAKRTREPLAGSRFEAALRTGKIALLIDALDEVPFPDRSALARSCVALTQELPHLPMLLASRPTQLSVSLTGFSHCELQPLQPSDIAALASRWFSDSPAASRRFIDALTATSDLAALAGNPLLLEMLAAIFRARDVLPSKPTHLLADAVDFVLSAWEGAKAISRSRLTIADKLAAFERLAKFMIEEERHTVNYDEAIEIMAAAFHDHEGNRRESVRDIISSSFLVAETRNSFTFAHRTLMEYFCARALLHDPTAVRSFVSNRERHEILVMFAEMTGDISLLVNSALDQREPLLAAKCLSRSANYDPALTTAVAKMIVHEIGQPFGAQLGEYLTGRIQTSRGKPSSHLLQSWQRCFVPNLGAREKGARFEAFAVMFFGRVFKVVHQDLRTESGELDLVCEITKQEPFWADFGGEILVECKNWTDDVPLADVSTFAHKAASSRGIKLAFILSGSGFTEPALRTLRNQVSDLTKPLIVPVDGRTIQQAVSTDDDLNEYFKQLVRELKHRRLY
jgi:DNA polymerase III delta prime subunit